jgi:hypothetical protein
MVRLGLLYRNENARWVAPVMVVPKPGSTKKRMVVDLRWINSQTVPLQYGMPIVEDQLHKAKGMNYFFTGDFLKGFWQICIARECQELFSFMTPGGVFTPTRLAMGAVDSPLYFQAVLEKVFRDVIQRDQLLLWIDDILAMAKTFDEYIVLLEEIFGLCRKFKLKLNLEKCCLGTNKAHWCGRIITKTGVTLQPRKAQALQSMPLPTTAGELGEFLHALNWMRGSIPRFQEKSDLLWKQMASAKQFLLDFHARVNTPAQASKKRNYKNVRLDLVGWTEEHSVAFRTVQQALIHAIEQAHFDPNDLESTICLLTDASQRHYASLLTQVAKWKDDVPVEGQAHEMLATFNGEFVGTALKWSTIEKEAFPIIKSLKEFRYQLTTSKGFRLFTDHANLVTLFRPEALNPGLPAAAMDKVYRWLFALGQHRVISMQHLPGSRNLWADLLSRWAHPTYRNLETPDVVIKRVLALKARLVPETPNEFLNLQFDPHHSNFDFPTLDQLCAIHASSSMSDVEQQFLLDNKNKVSLDNDIVRFENRIMVPMCERVLILSILIHGHDSACGHCSIVNTTKKIKDLFFWIDMDHDIKIFIDQCLACVKTKSGDIIPRPLGEAVHGDAVNHVVHFDYLFIESNKRARHIFTYILVLKDDFSGFIEMIPCEFADHYNVVDALQMWQARYGNIHTLVSDKGSHFISLVVAEYTRRCTSLGITHHFTVAYCPWSNGTIERVNRDILALFKRMVLNSSDISLDSWPFILPHVMSVINTRPSVRLDGLSPRQLFMARGRDIPDEELNLMFDPIADKCFDLVHSTSPSIVSYYDTLCESLDKMHKRVILSKRQLAQRNRVMKNNHIPVNFTVGDFVVVAIVRKKQHKLQASWKGPYRVKSCISSHVYECEDLLGGKHLIVHVRRMKFFASSDLNVTIPLMELIRSQDTWATEYVPEYILDSNVESTGLICVKVKWLGFDAVESTWESIEYFYEDAPDLVDKFLSDHLSGHNALRAYVKNQRLVGLADAKLI